MTSVQPLYDIFGTNRFHLLSLPLILSVIPSQFLFKKSGLPRYTPLKPPFFHARPPGSDGCSPPHSPTKMSSLLAQLTLADDLQRDSKSCNVSVRTFTSACEPAITARSSAYAERQKEPLRRGMLKPERRLLSLHKWFNCQSV